MEVTKKSWVLFGCEESQALCIAFRERGFKAFSCDLQPCSGGHPEWHFQMDLFKVIDGGMFVTESGDLVEINGWDMMVAFPPCTHLAVSGAAWFKDKIADGRQQEAIDFFMKVVNAPIDRIAIENPVGIMSTIYRKPKQIIQPYYFGDETQKTTCLWLKNLPPLHHVKSVNLFDKVVTHVGKGEFVTAKSGKVMSKFHADAWGLPPEERSKVRSKTFPGIAKAMAEQWGNILN